MKQVYTPVFIRMVTYVMYSEGISSGAGLITDAEKVARRANMAGLNVFVNIAIFLDVQLHSIHSQRDGPKLGSVLTIPACMSAGLSPLLGIRSLTSLRTWPGSRRSP